MAEQTKKSPGIAPYMVARPANKSFTIPAAKLILSKISHSRNRSHSDSCSGAMFMIERGRCSSQHGGHEHTGQFVTGSHVVLERSLFSCSPQTSSSSE
jgi:hypothetical protein